MLPEDWAKYFPSPPKVFDPLDQGMFETVIPEDRFGQTQMLTSPTDDYVPNSGLPLPAQIRQCRIPLPQGVKWNSGLCVSAELEFHGRRYPVRWACAEPLNDDGSLAIRPTTGLKI